MQSDEIRTRFLKFFEQRGHAILPSASLVPDNDPSVLFNTAGMQPLVPFLMGRPHPMGDKLANIQKCVRTTDIEDVGDNRHLTFFEMMGNWSLGSYFKKEAITWSYELLTNKEYGFGLDPKRLYVTVFAGDANAPRDAEAAAVWESAGMPKHRIYFKDARANWWPAVKGKDTWTGPTGPCSEMFYDVTVAGLGDLSPEAYDVADDAGQVIEIWNDVFMQFEKKDGVIVAPLTKKNVDTGAGFERICAVLQGKDNVFETDIFAPLMTVAQTIAVDTRRQRIISDHIRTAVFMIADGLTPSNADAGYVLRRIIRRMVFATTNRTIEIETLRAFITHLVEQYGAVYPNIIARQQTIEEVLSDEIVKFVGALANGIKEFERVAKHAHAIDATTAFSLYTSYGLPVDLTIELAREKKLSVDVAGFEEAFKKHQALSRTGAEQKFKGGLADTSEMSVKYHTATHLLHQALRDVLGSHVGQKGSNITPERLRFDFTHTAKMTQEEIKRVENIVNEKINAKLPVSAITLPKSEAEKSGAIHFFGEKYPDMVTVYYIGDSFNTAYSKEFCGGPHVTNTNTIGHFKILKEEAVSAGVRRIKAVVE